jgi:Cu+-exporting ATPase
MKTVSLLVQGIGNPGTATQVERILTQFDWVVKVTARPSDQVVEVAIYLDQDGLVNDILERPGARTLVFELEKAGFKSSIMSYGSLAMAQQLQNRQSHELVAYRNAFFISCIFTIPLLTVTMGLSQVSASRKWLSQEVGSDVKLKSVIGLLLATPVQFGCGSRFYLKVCNRTCLDGSRATG